MTMEDHVHEWAWFAYDGRYHCQVDSCDESRHPIEFETDINATERLSAEIAGKLARTLHIKGFPASWVDALKAYADTREGK